MNVIVIPTGLVSANGKSPYTKQPTLPMKGELLIAQPVPRKRGSSIDQDLPAMLRPQAM